MNTNTAYYGDENYSGSRWIKLAAGPLTLLYQNGIIVPFNWESLKLYNSLYGFKG